MAVVAPGAAMPGLRALLLMATVVTHRAVPRSFDLPRPGACHRAGGYAFTIGLVR